MRLIDADALADTLFEKRKNFPQWVADTIGNMPTIDAIDLLKEKEEQIKNRDDSLEKAREEIKWLRELLKEQENELTNEEALRFIEKLKSDNNELREKYSALLKEQGWNILTDDADGIVHGLPGDDGQYLMTDGEDIWIDDYVDGVEDGVWLDSGHDIRDVKAWMYMPKLPKEGR